MTNIFTEGNRLREGTDNKIAIKKAFIKYCTSKGYVVIKGTTKVTEKSVSSTVHGFNVIIKDFTDIRRCTIHPIGSVVRLFSKDFYNSDITNDLFNID